MPANVASTAELQKGYRELVNFTLDPKVQNAIRKAAQNPQSLKSLKADPLKFLAEKRLKVPADAKITVTVTVLQFCFTICRRIRPYLVICTRYCGKIII